MSAQTHLKNESVQNTDFKIYSALKSEIKLWRSFWRPSGRLGFAYHGLFLWRRGFCGLSVMWGPLGQARIQWGVTPNLRGRRWRPPCPTFIWGRTESKGAAKVAEPPERKVNKRLQVKQKKQKRTAVILCWSIFTDKSRLCHCISKMIFFQLLKSAFKKHKIPFAVRLQIWTFQPPDVSCCSHLSFNSVLLDSVFGDPHCLCFCSLPAPDLDCLGVPEEQIEKYCINQRLPQYLLLP